MNIKTGKIYDPMTGKPTRGRWTVVDTDGPDDANTAAILDPTVDEVDLGNNIYAKDIGLGTKVVATDDLFRALGHPVKGTKSAPKTTVAKTAKGPGFHKKPNI